MGLAPLSALFKQIERTTKRDKTRQERRGKEAGRIKAAIGGVREKGKKDQGTATLISIPESRGTSHGN